jgi:uncharacterized repeat protein (TIGR01451 family)
MSIQRSHYRQPRFVQQLARRRRLELTPVQRAARSVTERLEERTLLSSYTWNAGAGTLLIDLGTNEQMAISEANGTRTFHVSAGTFTQSGGTAATGDGTSTINFAAADNISTSITVNNAGDIAPGNESVSFLGGNLTSGTISLDLTQTAGTGSSISFTTAATNFSTSGVTLKSPNSISDGAGGSISATTGTVALAGATGIGTSGNSFVTAVGTLVAQAVTGGIFLSNTGAASIAFSSASGDVNIANTGALTIAPVGNVASSSGGGNVTISTASPLTVNIPITDSGGGDITLTAGAANSSSAADVLTINANVTASGGSGSINLNGNSLVVNAATVSATGAGNIAANFGGTGGAATFNNGSLVSAVNGNVNLIASTSTTLNGTGTLKVTGTGNISITSDDMAVAATASISASDGVANANNIVVIQPNTANRAIDVGSNTAGTLGLTNAELGRVTAEFLQIGNLTTAGNLNVSSAITAPATWNTLALETDVNTGITQAAGAPVTVTNLLALGATGVALNESGNTVSQLVGASLHSFSFVNSTSLTSGSLSTFNGITTFNDGPISVKAGGAGSVLTVNQPISTSNGATAGITLSADDMAINAAVSANSTTSIVALSAVTVGQNINLGSNPATPGAQLGLTNAELAKITAGILRIGDVSITNNITVTAPISAPPGWNTLSLFSNVGSIAQNAGASITVGNLLLIFTNTVSLNDPGNTVGTLSMVGVQGASFVNSTSLTMGSVDPALEAVVNGGAYTGSATSIHDINITALGTGSTLTVAQPINSNFLGLGPGNITLAADDIAINAAVTASTAIVTLEQGSTTTRPIDLGLGTTAGDLGISTTELGKVTAGTLRIGRADNPGSITVTAPVSGFVTITLSSGGSITDAAPFDTITATNLAIRAGTGISLDTKVSNLAVRNTTSGNVLVSNTGAVTLTTIDTLNGSTGNTLGNFGSGTTAFKAASPFTFAVNFTSGGTIATTTADNGAIHTDNITVNSGVTVTSNGGDVVLDSGDDVVINGTVQSQTRDVDLVAGLGDTDGEGVVTINGNVSAVATVTLNVSATDAALAAGTPIATESAGSTISSAGLLLLNFPASAPGPFNLFASATNAVGVIAATTHAGVNFSDSTALSVGSVTSTPEGITSNGILSNNNDIALAAGGAIAINQGLNAGTANARLTSTAGITQAAAGKITATNLGINAGGAVALSTASPMNHVTGTVAIDTTSGTLDFTSDTGFTIGAVTAASAFTGASGISAPGNVNATAGGALSVVSSTTVNSTSGNVTLKGGGTITVDPTSSIKATAGTITIAADPGIATTFTIPGAALQATSASILGDTGNDVFNLSPSATTSINVDGKAPVTTPGDALNLDITSATNPFLTLTTPPPSMAGSYTFGNFKTVSFTSIEALSPTADLSISKSDGVAVAIPGTNETYTIVVTNNGPVGEGNITVADIFPAAITSATWTAVFSTGGAGTTSGSGNINQIISLPAGGTATYTVTAHIASSATGTLANTASVSSAIPETNTTNNSATDTDTLLPLADVQINKTGPATAIAGNNVTYQITTTNAGPSDAQAVMTNDTPPAGTTLVSFVQNTGPASGGALPAGQSETFTIVLHINSSVPNGTTLINTASATTTTTDTNTFNNSSSASTLVSAQADVSVTKTGPATINEGQNLVYTITVANGGASDAQSVNLTDLLPAGTTFVSWVQSSGPSFTLANNVGGVSATIPTLAAGSSATFTLTVNVPEEGAITNAAAVTTTTFDPNAANNGASLTTTVNDAPLTAVGTTILVSEGQVFNNKVVAHFSDANPNPDVLDFSATINWGDGTSSVGTIAENGSGGFDVSASHQYLEQAANLPVTVTIKDAGGAGAIAHSAASIADAPLTPTGGKIVTAVEGQPLTSVVLGGFVDTDPNGTPADYTVIINWGDGSPTSLGLVTPNGAGFDVSGTHTYADEGLYLPVITVNDEGGFALGGFTTTLNAKVTVGDAALTAAGTPVSAVEGQSVSAQVATFTDANPAAPLSDLGATINWGDGSPATAGVITQPGGVGTPFVITGTHTYGEEGSFTVTTSIKDIGGSTATATSTATVSDAALTLNPATLPIMLEGASFSGPIATLFDADPFGTQSDYTVTVNWGDGTSSAGTVGAGGPFLTGSQFQLNSSHTYSEEGLYSVQISVADAGGAKANIFEQALVNDAPLTGLGKILAGVEGTKFSGAVASFSDADPGGAAGDYISTIDWGDGAIGVGLVKANGAGGFDVTGNHTYAEEGVYPIAVAVIDSGAHVNINSAITVIDPAVAASGGAALSSVEGISTPTVTLATFTDPGGAEPLADYSASMNWGDASSSPMTISFAGGVFTVSGAHAYAEEGTYSTLLTIHHDTASDTSVGGSAVVTDAPLSGLGKSLSAAEGAPFTGAVGSFSDANPLPDIADFSATIDWGDNITTAATISSNGSGGFNVNGTHTYEEEAASLPIKIVVKDLGGAGTNISSNIAVTDAALAGSGVPLAGQQEGNTFSGTVADFTDADPHGTPSDYNATINWGDGATTDGIIASDGVGGFNVLGAHIYVEEANYIIHTSINDVGGASTSADTSISISEAPITATAQNLSLTEGQSFAGLVGGMIDANPFEPAGDYSVSIDWGDGSAASSGLITPAGVPGQFSLSASHTYAEDGIFAMTITVMDDGKVAATADGLNTVAESPIAASGVNISGLVGANLSKTVAKFTDPAPEPLSDYDAMINWGDGNVTSGNIVLAGGSYAVNGNHTYSNPGLYSLTISINDDGTLAAIAGATANITAPANFTGAAGKTFTIWEGNKFNTNVASFTYGDPSLGAASFSAKVTWGDGSTTNGSIVKDSAGHFHVMGAHTYGEQGTYATSIKITDSAGHSITAHATAHVPDAPLTAGAPLTLHVKAGKSFSGTVGNFIDNDPLNTLAADYKATINWGDGKTSKATFALTSTGRWKVLGTHTFGAKGTYHLTLTVQDAGASAKLIATVIVN